MQAKPAEEQQTPEKKAAAERSPAEKRNGEKSPVPAQVHDSSYYDKAM